LKNRKRQGSGKGVYSKKKRIGEKHKQAPLLANILNNMSDYVAASTERKRLRKALWKSGEKYKALDELPIGICEVNIKGKVTFVNKRFEQVSGYSREEVVGKSGFKLDMFKDETLKYLAKRMKDLLLGKPSHCMETQFRCRDGRWIWVEIEAGVVKKRGLPVGFQITSRDVTERKQMEDALREEHDRLKGAQRLGRIGNWEYDVDSQRIVWSDEVFVLYERDPALGPPTAEEEAKYYSADQVKILRDYAARSIKNSEEFTYDLEAILPSGKKAFFAASMRPIKDESGRVIKLFGTVQDITERRRMEEKLAETSTFLDAILSNMTEQVAVIDEDYTYQFVNESYQKTFNAKVGGKCYAAVRGLEDPCHHLGIPCEVQEILKKKKDYFEDTRPTSLGHKVIQIRAVPATASHGKPAVISVSRDVTEESRAKEQLEKAYSMLRATLESTADGIIVVDNDEKITDFNQRCVEMFQTPESILTSRDDRGLISFVKDQLKDPEGFVNRTRELFAQPDLERSDLLEFKDGRIFERYSRPQRMGEKTAGRVVSFRDITERKRMEDELRRYSEQLEKLVEERTQALRASEEKYRLLIDNMAEVVFTIDLDGNFTFVSPQVESMVGYSERQLHSMNMKQLIAPEYLPEIEKRLRARIQGEKDLPTYAFEIIRADGKRIPVEMQTTPVYDEKGTLIAVQGVARDITERRKIEQIKDRFISAVTHELRTPLTSISGYVDLALSGNFRPLSGEMKSSLEVIKRNANRLISIADDLLDIRRIESGKLKLNISSLDLKEIIDHCSIEIKPFLKEKQELHVQVLGVLPSIQGDRVRLSQVLMNLLSNAAKFTPEGGNIKLSVKDEEGMVKVQVSDTGIGIRKEDLQRVFEPFAAIQKPTYIKGTGLGLSVTKALVNAHDGRIWVESEGEGKGATFTFTLPKHGAKEVSQTA